MSTEAADLGWVCDILLSRWELGEERKPVLKTAAFKKAWTANRSLCKDADTSMSKMY